MMDHRTIIRTNDPNGGDGYVTLLALDGASYPITSATRLLIDGKLYMALRSEVSIVTAGDGMILTTISVVADNGS